MVTLALKHMEKGSPVSTGLADYFLKIHEVGSHIRAISFLNDSESPASIS